MTINVLAIDLGASSGRGIVGIYSDGKLSLEEIHRFTNGAIEEGGYLYWDIDHLFSEVIQAIQNAKDKFTIHSLAIDTWGVDFGLVNQAGEILQNPYNYRDKRTKTIFEKMKKTNYFTELYQKTGTQVMPINTLFQLLAYKEQQPKIYDEAATLLLMPDLLNYLLTGIKTTERTIASTTQLLDLEKKTWNYPLIGELGIKSELFPPIQSPGDFLGVLKPELGLGEIDVINCCQHDTASAVVSVPTQEDFLFVSCGTWSLIGTEIANPIINELTAKCQFTNELGYNGTTRLLKNCTGLWIVQQLLADFKAKGIQLDYSEVTKQAEKAISKNWLIDTNSPDFAHPGNMICKLQEYCRTNLLEIPQSIGELFRCAYESLASTYDQVFKQIEEATEKKFKKVYIIGGGSQASLLCQLVANQSGKIVHAGPVEATAMGNIAVQLIAHKGIENIESFRKIIAAKEAIQIFKPVQKNKGKRSEIND